MPRPQHWTHQRTDFFKYMSFDTAKAVLTNQQLRWSPASLFNDPFDLQFDLHLDYDRDGVIKAAKKDLWDFYSFSVQNQGETW